MAADHPSWCVADDPRGAHLSRVCSAGRLEVQIVDDGSGPRVQCFDGDEVVEQVVDVDEWVAVAAAAEQCMGWRHG